MTDKLNLTVREPCEHGWYDSHLKAADDGTQYRCSGGKEITLRKAPIVDSYRTYDVPDYIEAKVYIGQVLTQKYVWVEVDGND